MINEYVVRFNKGNTGYELHISAHNREEAIKLAEMQAKYSRMAGGKFKLIDIRMNGEKDTFLEKIDEYCFIISLDKIKKL